jgi:hypothetical protein
VHQPSCAGPVVCCAYEDPPALSLMVCSPRSGQDATSARNLKNVRMHTSCVNARLCNHGTVCTEANCIVPSRDKKIVASEMYPSGIHHRVYNPDSESGAESSFPERHFTPPSDDKPVLSDLRPDHAQLVVTERQAYGLDLASAGSRCWASGNQPAHHTNHVSRTLTQGRFNFANGPTGPDVTLSWPSG